MFTFTKIWILVVTITTAIKAVSCFPATSLSLQQSEDGPVTALKSNSLIPSTEPGTDEGLYNEGLLEGDIVTDHLKPLVKNAVADRERLWPNGVLVYKIEDDVGCPDSPQCDMLMKAMDYYHKVSCIRFKEWTGEENYVNIFYNNEKSGACYSSVGRMGGKQSLSLGQRCWYDGIVTHELGHAIGFWHEMNRPDRDDWIYVYWNNIQPGFTSAFAKYDYSRVDTLGEPFDYRSIMMYDEYAFSKDGVSPTLRSTGGTAIGPIWKKKGLSSSDRRRLTKLYQCDGNKPLYGFPYDISCRFDQNTCGFQNSAGSKWQRKNINVTTGYVSVSSRDIGREPSRFVSPIIPGLRVGDTSRGPIGCARFYFLLNSRGQGTLKLEQAYLNSLTAMKYDRAHTFSLWKTAPSGNSWKHVEIPLYVTSPFRLIFSAEFDDADNESVASLDSVEIFYKSCANPVSNNGIAFAPAPPVTTNPEEV